MDEVSLIATIIVLLIVTLGCLGGYDVLVNNAGISGPTAPVEEIDPDECEKVMTVDLNGTFNVTRLVIHYLKKSNGALLSICLPWLEDLVMKMVVSMQQQYGASSVSQKTLSIELGAFGITANAILSGAVAGAKNTACVGRNG